MSTERRWKKESGLKLMPDSSPSSSSKPLILSPPFPSTVLPVSSFSCWVIITSGRWTRVSSLSLSPRVLCSLSLLFSLVEKGTARIC